MSRAGRVARVLESRLGAPDLGVVLGSGFEPLAEALGASDVLAPEEISGLPRGRADGHRGGVSASRRRAGSAWVFHGRIHLYEGLGVVSGSIGSFSRSRCSRPPVPERSC